ncbi:hypothetical protein R3O55_012745 [Bacteroides hominis]|uniref:hypothetical protein n=1 Tax=Bacteroides hominis TaxID=2763023 RepID=UPI002949FFAE|nr:hypothetical protein [Bacteroides hominis (ex Liu et al. 2022)]MDV6135767.1 hypothetical protein [Bacteroides hominis (ex Liu et al. 2022)]MDV6153124.1 hypothetical protein [Bacteroides hominis (ex Liu et al. 2022)]
MEDKNLWGTFNITDTRSPKSILQEQAGFLSEATKNILKGEVSESTISQLTSAFIAKYAPITKTPQIIKCTFYVVAPKMANYKMALFEVTYSILEFYPITINDLINGRDLEAQNKDEFIHHLTEVIQNESIRKIIQNLIIQSV